MSMRPDTLRPDPMAKRSRYVAECREMAADLTAWARHYIGAGDVGRAGEFAKVAVRNAFVVLGLRYNCAADHGVDVS